MLIISVWWYHIRGHPNRTPPACKEFEIDGRSRFMMDWEENVAPIKSGKRGDHRGQREHAVGAALMKHLFGVSADVIPGVDESDGVSRAAYLRAGRWFEAHPA